MSYRFRLSIDITAGTARVWRALCDPAEVIVWDASLERALDAPPDYPRPGQRVHWRLRSGSTLVDEPQVVLPERALRSRLRSGRLRLDETYTLEPLPNGCRLAGEAEVSSAVPLLDAVDGRLVQRDLERAFDAIKRHCQTTP
jgi:hypothetical protein